MVRIVPFLHPRVVPVAGKRVLDQVVGPDTEVINLFDEHLGDHHRRGKLDHDPKPDLRVKRFPLPSQLLLQLLQDPLDTAHLVHP